MNNLSRNRPIVLVVGAAGFLGSHLAEQLLKKGIQLIGVDNLITGSKEYLAESFKSPNFIFLNNEFSEINKIDLPRLDYAYFSISEDLPNPNYLKNFKSFINFCSNFKQSKIVLVSSITNYSVQTQNENLKTAESLIAKFALEEGANVRVVRLSTVYGPRMHFREDDAIISLIKSALKQQLQKETPSLDFTTKALYIDDAINLLLKTLFHGGTAHKIYDGSLLHPIKVSEIRQILLDPIWYERAGFKPTLLPPWTTPNLIRTQKELSFRPKTPIVSALKQTVTYFKTHPQEIKKADILEKPLMQQLEDFKFIESPKKEEVVIKPKSRLIFKTQNVRNKAGLFLGLSLISYALILPMLTLTFGGLFVRHHLKNSTLALQRGEFDKALIESESAQQGVVATQQFLDSLNLLKVSGVFKAQLDKLEQLLQVALITTQAQKSAILGINSLNLSIKILTAEEPQPFDQQVIKATTELNKAQSLFNIALARLADSTLTYGLPQIIVSKAEDLKVKTVSSESIVSGSQLVATILPNLAKGKTRLLVLLVDNRRPRPGGGVVISLAKIEFENAKITKIESDSVENFNRQLTDKINPPDIVKDDLGKDSWSLKDSAVEPDYPTNARWADWFYHRQSGETVIGVISFDLSAVNKLLQTIGPLTVGSTKVSADSLYQLIDNQTDSFLASLTSEIVNRMVYARNDNWVILGQLLQSSIQQKHFMIYFKDPRIFSLVAANRLAAIFPRQAKEEPGERSELLSQTDNLLGSDSKTPTFNKEFTLLDQINEQGRVVHKLTITYQNESDDKVVLKTRTYLSSGSKLTKAFFAEDDISSKIKQFSDYNRATFAFTTELLGKESKKELFEWEDAQPLQFVDTKVKFRTDFIKQIGAPSTKLDYQLQLEPPLTLEKGESRYFSNLDADRSFEAVIKK